MLKLVVNNRELSLEREFSLRLQWANPACFMDDIPGDVGLGISLPVNEVNRGILGNPERFEKYTYRGFGSAQPPSRKLANTEVRWKGTVLLSGTLNITGATSENYTAWLQSDVGVMGEVQRERFLPDMEWPEEVEFDNKTSFDDDDDDYRTRSIKNRGFWEGKGREETVGIKFIDENGRIDTRDETRSVLSGVFQREFASIVNFLKEGNSVKTEGTSVVVSPFLHLRYVIKEALRMNRFYITRNDMVGEGGLSYTLSLFKNLMVYNNFNIVDVTFETVPYEHSYWDYDLNDMVYETVTELIYTDWSVSDFNYKDLLPRVKMKDFLLGIQNTLNMVFWFRPQMQVEIIDRNAITESEAIDLNEYFLGEWEIGEAKDVALKFIPEYDKDDGRYATNFHDLSDRRNDFKEAVATYADLETIVSPEFGELRLVLNVNKIYEYKWKVLTNENILRLEDQVDALGWEFVSSGPQPFLFGDNEEVEEVRSPCSTLQRGTGGLPEAVQRGNLGSMRSIWNDFTFRLINYNTLAHPGGLSWEGENGLFEKRWRRWATFWRTRQEVEADFDLPMNVLLHVLNNLTGKFRTRHGEFIIAEIETEIGTHLIGRTRIKGYKI